MGWVDGLAVEFMDTNGRAGFWAVRWWLRF